MSVGWFTSISALLLDRYYMYVLGAAGHPNGVFPVTPKELVKLTGAPVEDVTIA